MSTTTIKTTTTKSPREYQLDEIIRAGRCFPNPTPSQIAKADRASNQLLADCWPQLQKQAQRRAPNTDAADDRIGEMGLRATIASRKYNPDLGVPFLAWMNTSRVASSEAVISASLPEVTCSRDERRASWAATGEVAFTVSLDVATETATPGDAFEDENRLADIRRELQALAERDRLYLEIFYGLSGAAEQSAEKIAAHFNVGITAVRRSLKASREALRRDAPWLAEYLF